MTPLKSSRPSPALVISIIALVAALAGTAVAADSGSMPLISKSQTKKITKKISKKIAKKQANKAVNNFAANTLPIGGDELDDIEERSQQTTVAQNTVGTAEVSCDSDERVISGGWRDNAPPSNASLPLVYEDHRTNNGWRASIRAFGSDRTITVFAYCLEP